MKVLNLRHKKFILSQLSVFPHIAFLFLRGKKRKGLAAFRDTSSEDGYLIEEDGNKAWRGPAAAMAPTVPRVKTPEDEVQEVSIEMTDDVKPLGTVLLMKL